MEEQWKTFWEGIVSCTKEVCGVKKLVGGGQGKSIEWLKEVRQLLRKKHKTNTCRVGRTENAKVTWVSVRMWREMLKSKWQGLMRGGGRKYPRPLRKLKKKNKEKQIMCEKGKGTRVRHDLVQ